MSVTYSYGPGTYNLGRLSNELVAGGVTVVTIRGTTSAIDVVCADGTVQATVDGIVGSHSGATPPPHDYPALTGSTSTYVRGDGTLGTPAGTGDPAGTAAAGDASHVGAADPHTQYQKESEKDQASGYAGLSAASRTTKGVIATDDLIVDLASKGLVLKDTQATPHYWRVTVSTVGVLSTADLGTSAP